MPCGVLPSGTTSSELSTGQPMVCFDDAVVRQHVGLSLRGGGAVTAHGRKDERMHALRFPELRGGARNRRDIGDAAAAYADGDARAGLEARGESGRMKLALDFGGNIRDAAVGKVLAYHKKAGKLHNFYVSKGPDGSRFIRATRGATPAAELRSDRCAPRGSTE